MNSNYTDKDSSFTLNMCRLQGRCTCSPSSREAMPLLCLRIPSQPAAAVAVEAVGCRHEVTHAVLVRDDVTAVVEAADVIFLLDHENPSPAICFDVPFRPRGLV